MKRIDFFASPYDDSLNAGVFTGTGYGFETSGFKTAAPQIRRQFGLITGFKSRLLSGGYAALMLSLLFFAMGTFGEGTAGAACISITSPAAGATISGSSVAVRTSD